MPRRHQDSPPETHPQSPEGRDAGAHLLDRFEVEAPYRDAESIEAKSRDAESPQPPVMPREPRAAAGPAAHAAPVANWPVELTSRSRVAEVVLLLLLVFASALVYSLIWPTPEVAQAATQLGR